MCLMLIKRCLGGSDFQSLPICFWISDPNRGKDCDKFLPSSVKYIIDNFYCCYGFAWQGFGSGEAIGVASVRSYEKLPPRLTKPVPASSKADPPLAKAKPISDRGSPSVITYLRRERKKLP